MPSLYVRGDECGVLWWMSELFRPVTPEDPAGDAGREAGYGTVPKVGRN